MNWYSIVPHNPVVRRTRRKTPSSDDVWLTLNSSYNPTIDNARNAHEVSSVEELSSDETKCEIDEEAIPLRRIDCYP